MVFLRILLFFVILYLILKFVFRFLVYRFVKQHSPEQHHKSQKEGETDLTYKSNDDKKLINKDQGEYVDYEEVD